MSLASTYPRRSPSQSLESGLGVRKTHAQAEHGAYLEAHPIAVSSPSGLPFPIDILRRTGPGSSLVSRSPAKEMLSQGSKLHRNPVASRCGSASFVVTMLDIANLGFTFPMPFGCGVASQRCRPVVTNAVGSSSVRTYWSRLLGTPWIASLNTSSPGNKRPATPDFTTHAAHASKARRTRTSPRWTYPRSTR